MKIIKKQFNDKDRLDFLINRSATVPQQLPDGRWQLQVKAGCVLHTFNASTPRICIDTAMAMLQGRKAYIYESIPRIQP